MREVEANFHMKTSRDGIFKHWRSPGIDSEQLISPAYVAWRAGTTTLFLIGFSAPKDCSKILTQPRYNASLQEIEHHSGIVWNSPRVSSIGDLLCVPSWVTSQRMCPHPRHAASSVQSRCWCRAPPGTACANQPGPWQCLQAEISYHYQVYCNFIF